MLSPTTTLRSWRMWVGNIPDAGIRGNSKLHPKHRGKIKSKWRVSGIDHFIADMPGGSDVEKLRLTFTFHHDRKIDLDNLAIGMKPWVDGLVIGIGNGFDDDPSHVVYGEHQFVKCAKGSSKTEVLVEEVAT